MHGLDHPDHYDTYYTEKIWSMIPEVYRTEDGLGPQQDVLRQIVEVIAAQAAETRRSIDRLWEDQHIETCDDWAVPYIGDLVGTRLLSEADPRGRRVDVAQTVRFRRRRGTPALLEELARELSGWGVVMVEAFRRLGRTCHRLDAFPVEVGRSTRTPLGGTANLRNPRSVELAGTAFDEFFRTPDPRLLAGRSGRINLGNFNFHLFRLIPFETPGELADDIESINGVTPGRLTDTGEFTFTVDPSGRDTPLFSRGELMSAADIALNQTEGVRRCRSATEWEVAREIPCRLLSDASFVVSPADAAKAVAASGALAADLEVAFRTLTDMRFRNEVRLRQRLADLGAVVNPQLAFYRELLRDSMTPDSGRFHLYPRSIQIARDKTDLDPEIEFDAVLGADLSDRDCHPDPSDNGVQLLIDPKLGRFAFIPNFANQAAFDAAVPIVLRYFYGFSGSVGAGTYPRTLSETTPEPETVVFGGGSLTLPAVADFIATKTIADSLTYDLEPVEFTFEVTDIALRSNSEQRPYVKIDPGAAPPSGTALVFEAVLGGEDEDEPAKLTIDGIWLARELASAAANDPPPVLDIVFDPATGNTGQFDWDEIRISHSTFDPGGHRADNKPLPILRIHVKSSVRLLRISQSIVGPILVASTGIIETLEIVDSIVDAHLVQTNPPVAITNTQGDVRFEGITVFGDIRCERLLGTDSIVMGNLVVADTQGSCFRFSAALPTDPPEANQETPDRFHSTFLEILPHHFISRRFGDPGYGQLSSTAPEVLRTGAEDGSEMGAFSTLRREIRLGSVTAKVDEYKPVGILTQFIFEGEEASAAAE